MNAPEEIKLDSFQDKEDWMKFVQDFSDGSIISLSWMAYNTCRINFHKISDISSLLSIWIESSKSPAKIKHVIHAVIKIIHHP